jgi:glycosyltransferase involved in cell wall biosynthesis
MDPALMMLSILICSLPGRKDKLLRLLDALLPQVYTPVIGVCINDSENMKIGEKRNALISESSGKYVCFVDDDDLVSKDYIAKVMSAIENGHPDCVGIQGIMLTNSNCPRRFYHTIEVDRWYTSGCEYYRTPNHLNPIKRELVLKVPFNKYSNFGEDLEFSSAIKPLLKTEVMIDDPIYYYIYNLKPNETMFA